MNNFDSESFISAVCDDQFLYWEKQVGKNQRRNVDRKMDLQDHYVNYINWKDTKLARDIEKTVQLLPRSGQEVSVKDLKIGLKNYGLDEDTATKVIREVGTNDKRIRARRNSYYN